jgi:ankyrin repeat protein
LYRCDSAGLAALIAAGADVNMQNTQGKTPVDMAVAMQTYGGAAVLVQSSFDP